VTSTDAQLPLPGGQPEATVVVHPLQTGDVAMSEGWVHGRAGARGLLGALGIGARALRAPIVAYLVEHPTAGAVLIDTGFPIDVVEDKRGAIGALNAQIFRDVRLRPEETVRARLAARGLEPADVGLIVMTHLHVDHAASLRDFPGATVLVDEREWRAVHARGAAFAGYRRENLDPRLDYRLLRFPEPAATGLARLDQALDVFGDGSLRLLSTPGHTPGHLSVLARLSDREALLAGDVIYTLAALREGRQPYRAVDRRAYLASVDVLAAYDRAHPEALVVPGHDMEAWAALEPSYA